jgi:hypothetical protein
MNRSQYITSLVQTFHEEGNIARSAWDIAKGVHAGLAAVGHGATWGMHGVDQMIHHGANVLDTTPAITGAAALAGAAYLRHRHNVKKAAASSYHRDY